MASGTTSPRSGVTAPAVTGAVVAERLAAQLLTGRSATEATEVVGRLLAVQAQDPRGARLAVRARSRGLHAADVDEALTAERSLLVTWLNRGTLHLVRTEDYWWLHALTTPPVFTANARRLAQEGVSPDDAERGVAAIVRALDAEGPLTRSELRERVASTGVRVEGQAMVHLLLAASLQGLAVRGPVVGAEQAHVLVRDWLGAPPRPVERDQALAELARRYLAGHGPSSDRDLARWSGLPLRDARRGLAQLGSRLADSPDGLARLAGSPRVRRLPPATLLGAFDPVLLGWESREPLLGQHQAVVTTNGLFRPVALVDGRAVGTWSFARGRVSLAPFEDEPQPDHAAFDAEVRDVERFLSDPR